MKKINNKLNGSSIVERMRSLKVLFAERFESSLKKDRKSSLEIKKKIRLERTLLKSMFKNSNKGAPKN